jgi:hypothetical protein
VCGPLLVLGVIEFEVQALIAIGAWGGAIQPLAVPRQPVVAIVSRPP